MKNKIIELLYALLLGKRWKSKGWHSGMRMLASSFIDDYKIPIYSKGKIMSIHMKGFTTTDWRLCGLDNHNYRKYLRTAQYYSLHTINGEFSKWIDDKLTLKYLCAGTELDEFMPKYYFQITKEGNVLALSDFAGDRGCVTSRDILSELRKQKILAIKQIAGSIGSGFYKAEYSEKGYMLNGEIYSENEILTLLEKLREYLVIEYLKPHSEFAKFCNGTANTIRYLTCNVNGKHEFLKGYIRLGSKKSGYVENYNVGGVLCYLTSKGEFLEGNIIDYSNYTNKIISRHPDSNEELKGNIPHWDEIMFVAKRFSELFPQVDYAGFDFVVTDKNEVKILEINSLTSLDGLQINKSIYEEPAGRFFTKLLSNKYHI